MAENIGLEGKVKAMYVYLNDYARCDQYELINGYYRKRYDAYIDLLQERIKEGLTEITTTERREGVHRFLRREFDPVYDELRDEWMRRPLQMPVKYRPTAVEAVAAVLEELKE